MAGVVLVVGHLAHQVVVEDLEAGRTTRATVTEATFDTVIYLYCDPFDAMNPTVNGVYMDDDDGEGLLSAIFPENGVTLTPGNDYWFVICAYYYTQFGTYTVETSDNVALCGTVGTEDSTWSRLRQTAIRRYAA